MDMTNIVTSTKLWVTGLPKPQEAYSKTAVKGNKTETKAYWPCALLKIIHSVIAWRGLWSSGMN